MPLSVSNMYIRISFVYNSIHIRNIVTIHNVFFSLFENEFDSEKFGWILIWRIQCGTNSVLTMKTKYHIIEKLESDVTVTELAEIHGAGNATIADRIKIHIKKQKDDIDHYSKHVDSLVNATVEKPSKYTDVMKWF